LATIGPAGSPRWSSDGQSIAFDAVVDGRWQIHTVSARGGKPQQLTAGSSTNTRPNWSHDSRWIYFTSTRSGRNEIWKIPSIGGTPSQVSKTGGDNAQESEDAKSIFYDNNRSLWKMGVDGSTPTKVLDVAKQRGQLAPGGIFYFDQPASIRFLDLATGRTREILTPDKPAWPTLSISPDSHWLLYAQLDTLGGSHLMLVDHFR
jgi:Tol biopolymer transport system component